MVNYLCDFGKLICISLLLICSITVSQGQTRFDEQIKILEVKLEDSDLYGAICIIEIQNISGDYIKKVEISVNATKKNGARYDSYVFKFYNLKPQEVQDREKFFYKRGEKIIDVSQFKDPEVIITQVQFYSASELWISQNKDLVDLIVVGLYGFFVLIVLIIVFVDFKIST